VSYGEERPAAAGSDEQAYAANRRVEIIYLQ
jgi:outer membrane protein OmpA-like peptidoglycan-associated protein